MTTRYSTTAVNKLIEQLDGWINGSQDTLDTAESADYPNEDRIDKLTERINALTEAKSSLEEIEPM